MDFTRILTTASVTGSAQTHSHSTIVVARVRMHEITSLKVPLEIIAYDTFHYRYTFPRGASHLWLSLSCGLRRQAQTRRDNHNKETNNKNYNPNNDNNPSNNEFWLVRGVHDGVVFSGRGEPRGWSDHWGRGQLPGVLQAEPRLWVVHLVSAPPPLLPPGLLWPPGGVRVLRQVKEMMICNSNF